MGHDDTESKQSKKDDSVTSYIYSDIVMFALQAPWSLTFWLVYERIRNVTGMAGF